jgi:hypothetical protein
VEVAEMGWGLAVVVAMAVAVMVAVMVVEATAVGAMGTMVVADREAEKAADLLAEAGEADWGVATAVTARATAVTVELTVVWAVVWAVGMVEADFQGRLAEIGGEVMVRAARVVRAVGTAAALEMEAAVVGRARGRGTVAVVARSTGHRYLGRTCTARTNSPGRDRACTQGRWLRAMRK